MIASIMSRRSLIALVSIMVLVLILGGACTGVKMMADYDEQVDRQVTEIQKKVEMLLLKIENNIGKAQGTHNALLPMYEEIYADINVLEVRVSLKEKNSQTIKQVKLLKGNLIQFEEIHKGGISSADVITPVRNQFTVIFVSILKLERFKNRVALQ